MDTSIRLSEVLTKVPVTKHITFSSSEAIQSVCGPIFDNNPILKSFCFTRYFTDGSRAILSSETAELEATYFRNTQIYTYYHPQYFNKLNRIFMSHFIETLHPPVKQGYEAYLANSKHYFGIDEIYYVIRRHDDFLDAFTFSLSGSTAETISYILNHVEKIEWFCIDFYSKANSFINQASEQLIVLPWYKGNKMTTLITPDAIGPAKVLSHQEARIGRLLVSGRTAKEIGKEYNLSYRTVEHYIANMKEKLNVSRKSELIAELMKSGFFLNGNMLL